MRSSVIWSMVAVGILTVGVLATSATAQEKKVRFERQRIDGVFRSEGVAVGDFNKDGKKDIAAGYVWYQGPEFKEMHLLTDKAPQHDPKGYSNSFCTWADDLNGDGWDDILVTDFPGTPTWWFENPKEAGQQWKKHTLTPVTNNESPAYLDLDGDGKRELICGVAPDTKSSDGPDRQMAIVRRDKDPYAPWIVTPISAKEGAGTKKYSHGLGVGDVNKDGKQDILSAEGWWENAGQPSGEWKFHAAPWGGQAAHIFAYDIDGDGDQDVVTSSPHAFGLWWHEQLPEGQWKKHEIDMSFSQIHAVCLADMNGDGIQDLICGKRWWAHAAGDPGVNDPAVYYWIELKRENGRPVWTSHQFDHDSGPGTQFEIADVDGDGLLDVISSNKKGTHFFRQSRE
jgi:hypothetical protein